MLKHKEYRAVLGGMTLPVLCGVFSLHIRQCIIYLVELCTLYLAVYELLCQ